MVGGSADQAAMGTMNASLDLPINMLDKRRGIKPSLLEPKWRTTATYVTQDNQASFEESSLYILR